ncbi:MAG: serine/threonine-protein kinase, partial [Gemmataceae bacterium]|nr:serine/threonine-protein kinase [Gemmataceae bacterium]
IHRDLKPANVLLRRVPVAQSDTAALPATASHSPRETAPWCLPRQLEPKVTDFGLAKRLEEAQTGGTRSGAVMGTPSYIAPEQAAGRIRDIGPAVDIYALGAILYELLTGRPPFLGETPLETILQVLHDEPVPPRRLVPGLPADLETICLKCLEKQPSRRYPTASALAQDLRRFLEGEPISARPLSGRERLGRWIRRHPVWSVLAAASLTTVLVLLIGLTTAYLQVRAAVRQREAEAAAARQARLDEAAARQQAEALAQENERRRQEAEQTNARLQREIEERRRSSYALQLMQIATVAEHDPTRALYLLDDQQRCPVDLRDFTWAYLQQLCQRQHLVYQHHSDRLTPPAIIRTAVWSPKGSFIASADDTGQIRLWDPRTGQTWMAGQAHAGRISALAFSPDETLLITAGAGDGALRLWELPLALLQEARRSVEFLPPLRPLVRPMRLHRPYREVLQAHGEAGISALAVSPDGRYLVTGATDGTLQWWDLAAVLPVPPVLADRRQAMPRAALIGGLALAPLAPPPRGPLRPLFDVPLPAHLVPAAPPDAAQPSLDGVTCLSFARESSLLISGGSDGHARIWTAQGNRLLWSSDQLNAPIRAVALSPDGRTLAVADGTPIIRLILWQSALP